MPYVDTTKAHEGKKMKAKNQQKKLWFRAKQYGWGWYPATWEGWAVMIGFILLVFGIAYAFSPENPANVAPFLGSIFVSVAALMALCYRTGEKPEWRWDNKPLFKKK